MRYKILLMAGHTGAGWLSGRSEPLTGKIWIGDEEDRVVTAVQSRRAFESGLRSIGLAEGEVARAVTLRNETDTQLRAINAEIMRFREPDVYYAFDPVPPQLYIQRNSVWQRLADWFGGKEVRVLEATNTEARVPLFILSCADADGCTAAFNRAQMKGDTLTWSMIVFGSGIGGSRELSASASAQFTAAAGQTKVIFVPLTVSLQRVVVLEAGRQIGAGVQVDASSIRASSVPGLLLLPAGTSPPAGPPIQRFPLAGDTTGALAAYEWTYERKSEMHAELGLEAFNSKFSLNVGTELTTQVALKYELRGGYDYLMFRAAEGDGLLWGPPVSPAKP